MTIDIIYDSLDADSIYFYHISLGNAIVHSDLLTIVDINLYPGGHCNATQLEPPDNYIFTCPNGKNENLGNMMQVCIIDIIPDKMQSMAYIFCLETNIPSTSGDFDQIGEMCAKQAGLDPAIFQNEILSCAFGKQGMKLMKQSKEFQEVQTRNLDLDC